MGALRQVLAASVVLTGVLSTPAGAVVTKCNEPIPMSDGTVLRANVVLPDDQPVKRPVIVTVTGYNKDVSNPTGTSCEDGGGLAPVRTDLVEAGYAVMVVDDRGTGASGGQWDSWGRRTQADYPEVIDWIQAQSWSDGQIGMLGGSYMGITSLLMAEADAQRVAAGKPRAIKTVWADVPMSDAYRDVTWHGGAVDAGFIPLWLGLTTSLSSLPPSTTTGDPAAAGPVWAQHLGNAFSFTAATILKATAGEENQAYDGPFYRLRSPGDRAASIRVPVAWTGGWWDIFQRGEPLLFEQLANSPRKLFFMTPNYHGAPDADAWAQMGIGTEAQVERRWFDRYLRDKPDRALDAMRPVNLWTQGTKDWEHTTAFPPPATAYTPLHLGPGGTLQRDVPGEAGADDQVLLPASSPCSRLTAQWTAGIGALGGCETDNRTFEATALTWTTPPLDADTKVTGLVTADVWATLTAPDATLVAVLSDVDPGGASTQLTAGFLRASQRAIDVAQSTTTKDGLIVRPFHPMTKASEQAVPANTPQRYRIEIYPTSNTFKKGHRIRLTLSGANTPTTFTPVPGQVDQLGARISVLRGPRYPSNVVLPFSGAAPADVPLPSARACVSRRAFGIRLRGARRGERIRRAVVDVAGRRVTATRRDGRWVAKVDLRGRRPGRYVVRIRATTTTGRTVTSRRAYRTCTRRTTS